MPQIDAAMESCYLEKTVLDLMEQGFPRSYAVPLAPLAIAHPTWSFEPIFVPEEWSRILYHEVDENPARSLIAKSEIYAAYRHESNDTLYDTGHYQASHAAVSYFMDPRNFFNEADVFQFYCFADDGAHTDMTDAVRSVLAGTFMETGDAGDGERYADVFLRVGKELGIHPVYLAVRVRQEQGAAGGMTAHGTGGQLLRTWLNEGSHGAPAQTDEALLDYDGYYNLFNIQASGTGSYTVLRGAMRRAMEGTPEKAQEWGGSPAWDTPAKSIYGGASYIRSSYFANGQNTAYLQKYNVSPESDRRFWGQYMQNIVAALSEGRSLYRAYRAADALELSATFRIPVYADIPERCPDPAGGECAYTAASTGKYRVSAALSVCGTPLTIGEDYPVRLARGELTTLRVTVDPKEGLTLRGTVSLDGRLTGLYLIPLAKTGQRLPASRTVVYDQHSGCDQLHLRCAYSLAGAAAEDTDTYLLLMRAGEGNSYVHTLPLALITVCFA